MSTQTAGLLAMGVAVSLLWTWWALLVAGFLLLLVPEISALRVAHKTARASRPS